jgi:GNAT superfamily N-acetyltransferase
MARIPTLRPATLADADSIASLHVQAWDETYRGLLPDPEIDARSFEVRQQQWRGQFSKPDRRVFLIEGLGFVQMGAQPDPEYAAEFPEFLFALYLLRAAQGHGLGRKLLAAACGHPFRPFTALCLSTNHAARAFYRHMGGIELSEVPGPGGPGDVPDVLIGWRHRSF